MAKEGPKRPLVPHSALRIVIAGGGTAGHVNPALALASALEGDQVTFVGTSAGAEAALVPAAGWPLEQIHVRGFDRARPLSILGTGAVAARAMSAARRLLRTLKPHVVVGMGGYVSLPVCVAASAARIPVVVHEQNIVLGLANRVCKRFARRVAVSFEESLDEAGPRGVFVGNPVSRDMSESEAVRRRPSAIRRFELDAGRSTLLVFGGSQGARRINDAAGELKTLWRGRRDRQVVHIAGRSATLDARVEASADGLVYRVLPFVERMIDAYAVADLALCRGGATTVAELGAVGIPAIIVPYPHHRDQQQERHGRVLERAGAGVVLADLEATGERVAREADLLLGDGERLAKMRHAAAMLGVPDAAERLARVVREAAA